MREQTIFGGVVVKKPVLRTILAVTLILLVSGVSVVLAESIFSGGWPYSVPPTGHFNMFVANGINIKFFRDLHQLPMAFYLWADNSYEGYLATDWTVDLENNRFQVDLRENALWLNGDSFTAKDVWTTFMIHRLIGSPVWDYLEDVEIVNDYQVWFHMKLPSSLVQRMILRENIVDYGKFADQVAELVTKGVERNSSEWSSLAADFNQFRPTLVNATGPYYLDPQRVYASRIELWKNENSYLADAVHFDKIYVYNGDVPELTPLVLNNQIDYLTHIFPAGTNAAFHAKGVEFVQTPGMDGLAIYFNHKHSELGRLEVRKAITYAINRDEVGALALPGVTQGVQVVSGLGESLLSGWVDDPSDLIAYEYDTDKATALLESVGFVKKRNIWYKPNGDRFELTLQAPVSWSDAAVAAENIADQLTAFGIKTTFTGIEASQREPNINSGAFEMALSFWGTGKPHPRYAFEGPLLYSNIRAQGPGIGFDIEQSTSRGKVNFEELILKSAEGWDIETQKSMISTLVYAFNETLPVLPIYTKSPKNVTGMGIRSEWPDFSDPIFQNSPGDDNFAVISILRGTLKPLK